MTSSPAGRRLIWRSDANFSRDGGRNEHSKAGPRTGTLGASSGQGRRSTWNVPEGSGDRPPDALAIPTQARVLGAGSGRARKVDPRTGNRPADRRRGSRGQIRDRRGG